MKWSSRKVARVDYSKIALILFILALVLLLVMMFSLLAPSQATAGDITRTARRLPPTSPHEKVTTRSSEPIAILLCTVTAYSPTVEECDASPLVTASGKRVYVGGIAADWSTLPRGSIVIVPGYNGGKPCTVIDTGSAIKGAKLDVFMWSTEDARQWGRRRNVEVRVLYIPKTTP